MPKRPSPARQRALDAYASRVKHLEAFTSTRFPSPTKATKADKARAAKLEKVIFGGGDKFKPIIGKHTTVIHYVSSKRSETSARKKAQAFNDELEEKWAESVKRAEEYLEKTQTDNARKMLERLKNDAPTVQHVFEKASKAELRKIKKDVGQTTPDDINSVFIRQEKVPGEGNTYSGGSIVDVGDENIIVNGWQVIRFRPIDRMKWIADPVAEEKRVMDRLEGDFLAIAKHFKKKNGWTLSRNRASFSPQVGNHRYLEAMPDQNRVHNLLAYWRQQYGTTKRESASDRSPTASWLKGMNLVLFVGTDGQKQFSAEWGAQQKRRAERKRIDPQIRAAKSRSKAKRGLRSSKRR